MFAFIKRFIPTKVLLALVGAVIAAGTGWLLITQAEENGKLESQLEQWKVANQHWSEAWQAREKSIEQAQKRMMQREQTYSDIEEQINEYRSKADELPDPSDCLDRDLGDAFWLPISNSAKEPTKAVRDN